MAGPAPCCRCRRRRLRAAQAPARRPAPAGRRVAAGLPRLAAPASRSEALPGGLALQQRAGQVLVGCWGRAGAAPGAICSPARAITAAWRLLGPCSPAGACMKSAPCPVCLGPQTQPWGLCWHPCDPISAHPTPASAPTAPANAPLASSAQRRAAGPKPRRGRRPIQRWRGPWALLRAAWARSSTAWAPPWALATGRRVSANCMRQARRCRACIPARPPAVASAAAATAGARPERRPPAPSHTPQ